MKNKIRFADLRRLLLDIGFREIARPTEVIFDHAPTDTLFVFRPYRPGDAVAEHNLIEVKDMLDARGLLAEESFDDQFRKTPA
jgi:hypothetical protein